MRRENDRKSGRETGSRGKTELGRQRGGKEKEGWSGVTIGTDKLITNDHSPLVC